MTPANVMLWGKRVGAVAWDERRRAGVFEYDADFVDSGIEVAPTKMPLDRKPHSFPLLDPDTYRGLPGLLADSLPDAYGNALIDVWLKGPNSPQREFTPVDRLCYIGRRGMGALEFEPALFDDTLQKRVEVDQLLELANRVLAQRADLSGHIGGDDDESALNDILRVGTSAGGARAKAVLAWNPQTGEFRSGQLDTDSGFEPWLLKFDGADNSGLGDPEGYGKIEYAYHRMALAAGIAMSECRLHHEGGRSHFMTRRFDRDEQGRKLHMQSLWAMEHFNFSVPPVHAYEEAVANIRALGMGMDIVEEQFRRAVFNVMACNRDDHVKNISFLMDRSGTWSLSPAYDISYSHNPSSTAWTRTHQMSLNGKLDSIDADDLLQFANNIGIKKARASECIGQVREAVQRWPEFADAAEVPEEKAEKVQAMMRHQALNA